MPERSGDVLRGRYLVQNALANAGLRLADGVLRAVVPAHPEPVDAPVRRLLLAVGGHLGDAVLGTVVLPHLRRELPGAEIGVLAGSWTAPVLAGHPSVAAFHAMDHWKLDRAVGSRARRWLRHWRDARAVASALRERRYDLAIDLYPYFPNAARVLWRANIPRRVGFESGGFGPLQTTSLAWTDGGRHVAERHLELLRAAGIATGDAAPTYDLPRPNDEVSRRVAARLADARVTTEYVVLHPFSGNPAKEWPMARWRTLAEALASAGRRVVVTGAGGADIQRAAERIAAPAGAVNLCGRLSWDEFAALIAGARLVVTVDTVTGHVAAAFGRPTLVIAGPASNMAHWRPLGPLVTILESGDEIADVAATQDGDRMVGVERVLCSAQQSLHEGAHAR